MGASRSRFGTSIAAKQALSIGKSKVKLAVISVTRMMPVSGARTTAVKNAAIPTTASAVGFGASGGEPLVAESAEEKTALRP